MKLTPQERQLITKIARAGGLATKKKYGKAHYQRLAAHMNKVLAQKRKAVDN